MFSALAFVWGVFCFAVLLFVPIAAVMILMFVYSLPFMVYCSFKFKYDSAKYDKIVKCNIFKLFFRATKFYFQLICFKKPTL